MSEQNQTIQNDSATYDESELEAMKAKMAEMQKEADQLRELNAKQQQQQVSQQQQQQQQVSQEVPQEQEQEQAPTHNAASDPAQAPKNPTHNEDTEDLDSRSVYVGSVDYGASPEELQKHFQDCGSINRVTILMDKFTGHPKGFAYIEFADASFANQALTLNDSLFRGRNLKVTPKRTNVPGFGVGRGRGGYRGGRGGFARGGFRGRGFPRGRGGFRGGRGRFVPY